MLILSIILSLINGLFLGVDLSQSVKLKRTMHFAITLIITLSSIAIYNYLPANYFLLAVWGILFSIMGFIYIGIIPLKLKTAVRFHSAYLLLLTLYYLIRIDLKFFILFILLFFLTTFFTSIISKKIFKSMKSRQNVKEFLELISVLNGIFYFVAGLIIASDYTNFLIRIVNWIFN